MQVLVVLAPLRKPLPSLVKLSLTRLVGCDPICEVKELSCLCTLRANDVHQARAEHRAAWGAEQDSVRLHLEMVGVVFSELLHGGARSTGDDEQPWLGLSRRWPLYAGLVTELVEKAVACAFKPRLRITLNRYADRRPA